MKKLVDTEEANSIADCGLRNSELIKMSAKQAAEHFKVSPRTIERWFFAGKIKGEFVNSGKGYGKAGLILKVWIDPADATRLCQDSGGQEALADRDRPLASVGDSPAEDGDHNKAGGEGTSNADCRLRSAEKKGTRRVNPGEPGCRVVTPMKNGEPIWIPASAGMTNQNQEALPPLPPALEPLVQGSISACAEASAGRSGGGALSLQEELQRPGAVVLAPTPNLPAVLDSGLRRNDKAERIANLRFAFVQKFKEELTKEDPNLPLFKNGNGHRSKTQVIRKYLDLYNSGAWLPDIHAELGSRSKATLYNWLNLDEQGGVDALIPQYRGAQATPITEAEKKFLLTKLLHQNKPTIGDSINKCKFLLGDMSPSNPSKLRRFVNDFKKNNFDLWTLEREGQKALNDKCVPYAEREWRDLRVGEAVVADGHKLNFQVINPFTGKPCRAMMVMFWDWKSAFPLGWEIMLTESIQCVVAALRNAIVTLGKFPAHALLDNGKAFRASLFTKKFRFEETEIPGIFDRLNIQPHFAMPYNAQSKPIERFFRTFNDWFEREMPSYTGASINDKPAYMHRNEKRAIALHSQNDFIPTIPEAMELAFKWREYYIAQPLRARDGQTPYDIFNAEKGPGVDPFALHFLMMAAKARAVHRNGITFNGWHWYHDSLYGLKDKVVMFYSYYDLSQVYVFTIRGDGSPGEFLCVAKPIEKCKPFASEEFPEDMAAVKRICATKRKLVNTTKKLADMLQSEKQVYVDWNRALRDRPEIEGAIRQIKGKQRPKLISLSTQEEIDRHEVKIEAAEQPANNYFFERYDLLVKKAILTESEEKWIADYKSGEIGPGEWKTIYGECESR